MLKCPKKIISTSKWHNRAPVYRSKYPTDFIKEFTCCYCAPWWWCMTSPIFSRSCNSSILLLKQVSLTITHIPISRTHNSLLFTVPGSRAVIILRPGGRGLVVRYCAKWLWPCRRTPSVTSSPVALVPLSVALVAQVFSVLQVVCRRTPTCDIAVVVSMMVWRQRSCTCLSHQGGLLSRLATAVGVAGFVVRVAAVLAERGEGFVAVKVVTTDVLTAIFSDHLMLGIHRTWNRKKYYLIRSYNILGFETQQLIEKCNLYSNEFRIRIAGLNHPHTIFISSHSFFVFTSYFLSGCPLWISQVRGTTFLVSWHESQI